MKSRRGERGNCPVDMTLAKEACYKGLAFEEIMNSAYSTFIFAVLNCECLSQGTSILFMVTQIY